MFLKCAITNESFASDKLAPTPCPAPPGCIHLLRVHVCPSRSAAYESRPFMSTERVVLCACVLAVECGFSTSGCANSRLLAFAQSICSIASVFGERWRPLKTAAPLKTELRVKRTQRRLIIANCFMSLAKCCSRCLYLARGHVIRLRRRLMCMRAPQ